MTCSCIADLDALLPADNRVEILLSLVDGQLVARAFSNIIRRDTEKIERRRGRASSICATFCPFCGTRYQPETTDRPATAIGGEAAGVAPPAASNSAQEADRLREKMQLAIDILLERENGSPARSPAHNARVILEHALSPNHRLEASIDAR